MTEPTYFERDRYDLPLPLIGVNPNLVVGTPVLESSIPNSMLEEQKQLQQQSIAQALTQILSSVGVRFKFSIQHHPQTQVSTVASALTPAILPLEYRLWVRCHAPTSLDCQLIAAPLAQALRHLELQGFQDAIVEFSQSGTPAAATKGNLVTNWRLKIDLTPPSVRLKHWARWGDVQAISKLLNFALAPEGIQMSAILKDLTLQIFCTAIDPQVAKVPARKIAIETISPLLLELTPQGIQGATIHGMSTVDGRVEEPHVWMHWLDLPALGNPKFSPTPIILAARGDRAALNFVLERLLNPDLEQCFEQGGMGIFLLQRGRLLHVMSEAVICPIQSQVATTVVKVLRQLALPGIRGVRVHGRISGQLTPLWSYGVDFEREPLELPPVVPAERFVADEPSLTKIGLGQRISERLVATGIWKPQYTLVKSSQLVYQPRFKWEPSLLLLLVGVGLAIVSDLSVKFALDRKNLTAHSTNTATPISFNNPLLDRKLAQYKQLCKDRGIPDILIVGSSRALRGINPEVLRNGLLSPEYNNPTIYNFGINGATAQVVDSILRQLLTAQQLPKMVIWADGARAFNSGRTDRTYETIALSDGYRHLSLTSGLTNSSLPFLQAQSSFHNTYQAIDNQIDLGLANVSSAYYHRDRLKAWMQSRLAFADRSLDGSDMLHNLDPSASISDREINPDGFLALELQFDPATYYQKYHKVTGYSDGDYANFQLLGTQDRALKQVVNLLATHKIPLIFVNMPLSDIYLDKIRSQHETTFQQYMKQLMDSQQLTFVDLNGMLAKQYNFFSDPSHLNQLGASEVSNYLGRIPLISSQMPKSNIVVEK